MKQIIQNYKTGKLSVEEVPVPKMRAGGVLVANAYSLISVGTERSTIEMARKSLIAKARSRPGDVKKVLHLARKQGFTSAYKTAMSRLEQPAALGYSSAGVVLEVGKGVSDIRTGDRVACAGAGYASHAEVIFVPKNLCAMVPKTVPLDWAAFTTLGAIALQGIRQADVKVGEHVAVIGLGLLGQLTVQLLKASGCSVIGIDIDQDKVKLAKKSGSDRTVLRKSNVLSTVNSVTGGAGVDAVIITAATTSNDPFILAPEISRDRAKVVLVGVADLNFPREPYYRKELSLILARSYGPGRYDPAYEEGGIDYPIGYVRWTEQRNMQAILTLMGEKKLNIGHLISHRFTIDQAHKAYDLITGKKKTKAIGILFEYEKARKYATKVLVPDTRKLPRSDTQITVGFIGAGAFARSFLLPHIRAYKINLAGIADIQGPVAKMTAKKYGFSYCTSDHQDILKDKAINTVFIATRHDMHAPLIIEALKAGKHVFCEKPMCLNIRQLKDIIKVRNTLFSCSRSGTPSHRHPGTLFMIGFNRRFAPLALKAKDFMGEKNGPYVLNYRINAGMIPADHWLFDLEQGGGRIIGEVCHFVDLAKYFIGSRLLQVHAMALGGTDPISRDNTVAILSYEDGSIATISYFSVGDKDYSKEYIEIFGDQKVCIIDDFKKLTMSESGRQRTIKAKQDKGHGNEIKDFFHAIESGTSTIIPFEDLVETTKATFAIEESMRKGKTISIGASE